MSNPLPINAANQRTRITVRGLVLKFAFIWLAYTLSIGPMFWTWFGAAYVGGPYWVLALYSPLRMACYLVPAYGEFVEAYIWWWNFPPNPELAEPMRQIVAN